MLPEFENRKSEKIIVKLSPREKEMLQKRADEIAEGNLSACIRYLINKEVQLDYD